MGIIRPATPGFLVTLAATALLAVVSFCVPYFKSVYFLKANIAIGGQTGSITFGTLGYCLEFAQNVSCSSPAVGYELNINGLVGNNTPVQIPNVVVKWLTYCLVLHIVALGLAAGSAVFGLLAHVREMSMTCCSTCISGFAATVALLAFIFDISIFFAAKSRISKIGTAQLGNATWLTLAAWILLFFSSTFFTLGRCCISKRPKSNWGKNTKDTEGTDQMRLEAIKAEADRKARQNEMGLAAYPEYQPNKGSEYQPLTGYIDGDKVVSDLPYKDNNPAYGGRPTQGGGYAGGGYAKAPAGTTAMDDYYSPSRTYETPAPSIHHQQASSTGYSDPGYNAHNVAAGAHRPPQRQTSGYAPSQYAASVYTTHSQPASPPPPVPASNPYLAPTAQQYGHGAGGSSYHSQGASHAQQPTSYSNYDPYEQRNPYTSSPPTQAQNLPYNTANYYNAPAATSYPQSPQAGPDRSYTLGGGGYNDPYDYGAGSTSAPMPMPGETRAYNTTTYVPVAATGAAEAVTTALAVAPAPINTNTKYEYHSPQQQSPVKGPRTQNSLSVRNDDHHDAPPPIYDAGTSGGQGNWGKPTAH